MRTAGSFFFRGEAEKGEKGERGERGEERDHLQGSLLGRQ
jgi:hypothetical protein